MKSQFSIIFIAILSVVCCYPSPSESGQYENSPTLFPSECISSTESTQESNFPEVEYPIKVLDTIEPYYYREGNDDILAPFSNEVKNAYNSLNVERTIKDTQFKLQKSSDEASNVEKPESINSEKNAEITIVPGDTKKEANAEVPEVPGDTNNKENEEALVEPEYAYNEVNEEILAEPEDTNNEEILAEPEHTNTGENYEILAEPEHTNNEENDEILAEPEDTNNGGNLDGAKEATSELNAVTVENTNSNSGIGLAGSEDKGIESNVDESNNQLKDIPADSTDTSVTTGDLTSETE
ncbi:uncharacterized protein LOC133519676 [Cydia pomonella]|uniref:uncharacterized protein LOC133519676 n=1 Tax=Cydia pomonella TaxID=82600 RepID=UPI002ADE88D8|nr:uncharacterized protein LOC133519676 [Cydia pomonella]